MKPMKFYKCNLCGNMVALVKEGGGQLTCCGQPMTEIQANTTDAAQEKHVPVVTERGMEVVVTVGSTAHPMDPDHYIEWIVLSTEEGNQRKELKPGDKPQATFMITNGDTITGAFAYCNKHGLWKADGYKPGYSKINEPQ
jgi:superoxide reductase